MEQWPDIIPSQPDDVECMHCHQAGADMYLYFRSAKAVFGADTKEGGLYCNECALKVGLIW